MVFIWVWMAQPGTGEDNLVDDSNFPNMYYITNNISIIPNTFF